MGSRLQGQAQDWNTPEAGCAKGVETETREGKHLMEHKVYLASPDHWLAERVKKLTDKFDMNADLRTVLQIGQGLEKDMALVTCHASATDIASVGRAMEDTLSILSDGLETYLLKAPFVDHQPAIDRDGSTIYLGGVRFSVFNRPGERKLVSESYSIPPAKPEAEKARGTAFDG